MSSVQVKLSTFVATVDLFILNIMVGTPWKEASRYEDSCESIWVLYFVNKVRNILEFQNKIFASISLVNLLFGIVNGSSFAWRVIIGPISEEFTYTLIFIRFCVMCYWIISFAEIVLLHVLMMYGWKYFCSLDECFFFRILYLFNW